MRRPSGVRIAALALLIPVVAIVALLIVAGSPQSWQATESFSGSGSGLESRWDEYRTFGDRPNPWEVVDGRAVRDNERDPDNSEVVALLAEDPPSADQQVSLTVHALELEPTEANSWASVGGLVRARAQVSDAGKALGLTAYNGEIIYTDEFGSPHYVLFIWLADDWDFGDPPDDVVVLTGERLGSEVAFPVTLTVKAQGTEISASVVQADGTVTVARIDDSSIEDGGVGMISSLIAPEVARVEVDDFSASIG